MTVTAGYTTREAAAALNVTPAHMRKLAERARKNGGEWRLPPEQWPDRRTPLYRADLIDAMRESCGER